MRAFIFLLALVRIESFTFTTFQPLYPATLTSRTPLSWIPMTLQSSTVDSDDGVQPTTASDDSVQPTASDVSAFSEKRSIVSKIKSAIGFNRDKDEEPLKAKLMKMGLACFLSYGFVSNMGYAVSLSLCWYSFNVKTGLSPLASGQWPKFLAAYSAFYVINNFLRPFRVAIAVSVSPFFEKLIKSFQTKLGLGRKAAIALVVFLFNIVGTTSAMFLGVSAATLISGIPIR